MAASMLTPAIVAAQSDASAVNRKSFEIASVKRVVAPSGDYSVTMTQDPGTLRYPLTNLLNLLTLAYNLKDYQVVGPDWLGTENYFVEAKYPAGTTARDVALMLQTLLAERFGLMFHRETKELPMYALVVDKKGFKLHPVEGTGNSQSMSRRGQMEFKNTSLADFAESLTPVVSRPVLDKTGIAGVFDIKLNWTPGDGATVSETPGIFTALQEQLGLRLEPRREMVPLLVIEHVEKIPIPN